MTRLAVSLSSYLKLDRKLPVHLPVIRHPNFLSSIQVDSPNPRCAGRSLSAAIERLCYI